MKTIFLTLSLVFLGLTGLWAQPNPNDLVISGYVTNTNGGAVDGQWVCVGYGGSNPSIADSTCGSTNANGWYSITVINGSLTGPNQSFEVVTQEYCQNTTSILTETVQNVQGTVNSATVNFALTCLPPTFCAAEISFSVNPSDSTQYTVVGTATGTAPFAYVWDNGTTSQTTTYDFGQQGIYSVCLTVTDASGCVSSTCDTAYVGVQPPSCDAFFYYGSTPTGVVLANTSTAFTYSGQSQDLTSYNWVVQGGGLSITSDSMNPHFVFPSAGAYNVCLTVGDAQGCSNTFCASVTVIGNNTGGCQAYFASTDSSGYSYFVNYSQGNATEYLWDFGDGNTSNQAYPWHQYAQNGTYLVCLTITGPNCQDSFCDTVYVGQNSGNCYAGFSSSGITPVGYHFYANSQDSNYSYSWTINGQSAGDNGYQLYVPGFVNGTHEICLTVSDGVCSDSQCQTFFVNPDSCFGYISGQIFAGNANVAVDIAQVYLISYDSITGQLTAVQTASVDSGGYYYFPVVPCGQYLLKAATTPNSAYYADHLPTYYGNSTFWQYADHIGVGWVQPAVQYDVTLIGGSNPGGPGFIGGSVTEGANKVADEGDPVVGIAVMLFDMTANAIAYTYTDANGQFTFENLPLGTYQVYTELLNYTTIPATVTLTEEQPLVENIGVQVSEGLISTSIVETNFDALVGSVYPNPVVNHATLTLDFEAGHNVTMSVVDLAGRAVSTQHIALLPGKNTVSVSANGLTDGYYLLQLRDDNGAFVVTRKFVVTH